MRTGPLVQNKPALFTRYNAVGIVQGAIGFTDSRNPQYIIGTHSAAKDACSIIVGRDPDYTTTAAIHLSPVVRPGWEDILFHGLRAEVASKLQFHVRGGLDYEHVIHTIERKAHAYGTPVEFVSAYKHGEEGADLAIDARNGDVGSAAGHLRQAEVLGTARGREWELIGRLYLSIRRRGDAARVAGAGRVGTAAKIASSTCVQLTTPGLRFRHTSSAFGPFLVDAG